MTNYRSGHDAEQLAAEYLQSRGYQIRQLNWKTRFCEIDIIAHKASVFWFVEVKSRKNAQQGVGYEYVTPKKLQQMQFAADMWVHENAWQGDYRLAVISVDAGQITFFDEL